MHSTALEPGSERKPDYSRLSRAEVGSLLALSRAGKTQTEIAQALGCAISTVSRWLANTEDTTELAKLRLRSSAVDFVNRVIKDADVEQSLEVLDRIGVAEKRQTQSGNAQVQILIGMPGSPAGPDPLASICSVSHNGSYQTQRDSEGQQTQALPAPQIGAAEAKAGGESDAG